MRYGPTIAFAVLASVGAAGWYWLNNSSADQVNRPGGPSRRFTQSNGPVPVTVDIVKKQTVPVYREGIGNVQALNTITVRSQIDGRLISVDFVEGQIVHKGDVLARIDPTVYQAQYDQAVAKKAQDEAMLANARIDLVRYQRLAQTNAGPQQQADQQVALVAQLVAQVQADAAAIANAKAYVDYTVIASPINGRTGLRLVDPGNIVHAADITGLVLVTQVTPIANVFTLPQRDLPTISAALARGNVQVEALEAADNSVLARGTLQTIDNQIDVTTGTIKLKAVFPNEDLKLWPGQFLSTRVVVDTLVDAKIVPTTAIRRGPNGTFVYTVGADGRATVQAVKVLLQDDVRAVIGSGVEVGARVVTVGFAQLADGKLVQIGGEEGSASDHNAPSMPPGRGKTDDQQVRERQHGKERGTTDHPHSKKHGTKEAAQ
jgi:membrane fusion protein, multidrug efflux system